MAPTPHKESQEKQGKTHERQLRAPTAFNIYASYSYRRICRAYLNSVISMTVGHGYHHRDARHEWNSSTCRDWVQIRKSVPFAE